jgi:hypothetical protein
MLGHPRRALGGHQAPVTATYNQGRWRPGQGKDKSCTLNNRNNIHKNGEREEGKRQEVQDTTES